MIQPCVFDDHDKAAPASMTTVSFKRTPILLVSGMGCVVIPFELAILQAPTYSILHDGFPEDTGGSSLQPLDALLRDYRRAMQLPGRRSRVSRGVDLLT